MRHTLTGPVYALGSDVLSTSTPNLRQGSGLVAGLNQNEPGLMKDSTVSSPPYQVIIISTCEESRRKWKLESKGYPVGIGNPQPPEHMSIYIDSGNVESVPLGKPSTAITRGKGGGKLKITRPHEYEKDNGGISKS